MERMATRASLQKRIFDMILTPDLFRYAEKNNLWHENVLCSNF